MKLTFIQLQQLEYLTKEFAKLSKNFDLEFEIPFYKLVVKTDLGVLTGDFLDYESDNYMTTFNPGSANSRAEHISEISHLKGLGDKLRNKLTLKGHIMIVKKLLIDLNNAPEMLLPFLVEFTSNEEFEEDVYPIVKNVKLSGETYPFLLLDEFEFSLIGLIEA